MIELVSQVADVEREVDLLLASDETIRAIEEVESALDELEQSYNRYVDSMRQRSALLKFPDFFGFDDVNSDEIALRQQAVEAFDKVSVAWDENRARIRQSGTVGDLVAVLSNYTNAINANTKAKWFDWVNGLASDFAISEAELVSVKSVPDYIRPIEIFKRCRDEFTIAAKNVPEEAPAITRLAGQANKLREIKGSLRFDLPEFVLEFFDTLNRDGAFPFAKLTPELSDWLSENNELKNLSIVRRGISRF